MTVLDLTGNDVKADSFEGAVTVGAGSVSNASVASDAAIASTKIAVAALASTSGDSTTTADDLAAVLVQILDLIDGKQDAA